MALQVLYAIAFALVASTPHLAAGKSIHQRSLEMQGSTFRPIVQEPLDRSQIITASVVVGAHLVPQIAMGKASANRVVWAQWDPSANTTGWGRLEMHTNGSFPDEVQAEAAGFLEGYLTAEMIWYTYVNVIEEYCKDEYASYCSRVMSFLSQVMTWADVQVSLSPQKEAAYWHQYKLILIQQQGLMNGFNTLAADVGGHTLHLQDFMMMALNGDLETLETLFKRPDSPGKPKKLGAASCSAIVKVLDDYQDVYFSHDTWDSYYRMLRIYKAYDLQYSADGTDPHYRIPGAKISFSSYAINLQSNDDFYNIGTGLAVMETTIGNNNASLLDRITFTSLPYYFRVQLANRLARSGEEWTKYFSMYNSGTYNNMWMVFDYHRFTPGSRPEAGAFTVLEQLPGFIHVEDMTDYLVEKTYFSSYNVAYFPETFSLGGFDALVKQYGDFFTYAGNPRAKIFARDQHKAVDLDSVLDLMRYNDFKHDEYGRCNCTPPYSGENGIAARSDLNPSDGKYELPFFGHRIHGATDCKITNSKMMKELEAYIVSGPTTEQQPVFKWSTSGVDRPMGHPDAWQFEPIKASWVEL